MAKWRGGADDGRCAETRQRATLRDRPPPPPARHTTRTTRTTHYALRGGLGAPGRLALPIPGPTAPSCRAWLLQRLVCRFEGAPPQRASTQGLAWLREPIGCRPQEPRIPETATATAVRPIPPWPLSARCCPFSHSCRQAALRSQNYKPCPVPGPLALALLLLCSCSCSLLRLWPPANPPTPSLSPVAFRLSPFAFAFAFRLSPCTLRHPPAAAFALHAPSLPPLPFPSRSTPQTLTRFNSHPLPVQSMFDHRRQH
jgi:hypothetical protein